MNNQTITTKPVNVPVSPEILREQLLRPLPRLSWRVVILLLLVVLMLSWSVAGTQTSISTLMDGLPDVWNFITRLFPPEFELARGTERTFLNGGQELSVAIADAEITIRNAYATTDRLFIYMNDQPIPVLQRELPQYISLIRNAGVETVRYVVNATGITIGFPTIVTAVVETIQMAIIGTIGAVLLAIPFSLLAAKNVSPHPLVYQITRLVLNTLRSVPELIYGLIFVAAVGLGPFPGVLAIIFGSVGSLSRLFAEAIEQIDPQQVLAVQATGAGGIQTFMYAVMPQAVPLLISYSLVYFEHNVRNATILGYVGAGGVGFELQKYMALFQYDKMMGTVIILVLAVTVIDRFSNYVRSRFI